MDQKEPIDRITGGVFDKLQNQVNLKNRQIAEESGSTSGDVVRVPADVAPYIDHTLLKPETTREEINRLCDEAAKYNFYKSTTILKVIIETGLLTDNEKVIACQIARKVGADFVKTSTGFAKGGAKARDIALMKKIVGPKMGVKASAGIRSFEDARLMIESGATRIGTSASVAIVTTEKGQESY